jgi:hypothetical protein
LRGLELAEAHTDVFAKYPRFVHSYIGLVTESKIFRENFIPRDGWQSELVCLLDGPADPRKIHWYVDIVGNSGKSYFATHYTGKSTYYITGGKAADIFYGYQYEEVVIFDLARMKQDYVQYDVMENFKNGQFYSTKYECKVVKFNVPHVVVFSNFQPAREMLSADRWDIKVINL